jgi:hypothetical protein
VPRSPHLVRKLCRPKRKCNTMAVYVYLGTPTGDKYHMVLDGLSVTWSHNVAERNHSLMTSHGPAYVRTHPSSVLRGCLNANLAFERGIASARITSVVVH